MKFRSIGPAEEWFCECLGRLDPGTGTLLKLKGSEQPYCNDCGCLAPWTELDDDITSVRAEPID